MEIVEHEKRDAFLNYDWKSGCYHFRGRRRRWRPEQGQEVLYIFHQGESVLDGLVNRRSRPSDYYRKEVLPRIKELYPELKNAKFVWSQKAGCDCPCSPGFVISKADCMGGYEYFVTITDAVNVKLDAERESRVQQLGIPLEVGA